MKPEDSQIDVLLRRYVRQAKSIADAEHLDADELNAFTEGKLSPAARSRYVSHLADCNDCRQLAAQLATAAGLTVAAEQPASTSQAHRWWQNLLAFMSPPVLRYAAFAVVLIAVAGVVLIALRRQHEAPLLARNTSGNQTQVSVAKETEPATTQADQNAKSYSERAANDSRSAQQPVPDQKQGDSSSTARPASPTKPNKEAVASAIGPETSEKKAAPALGQSSPSFAPPPPAERRELSASEERSRDFKGIVAGPSARRSESPVDKLKTKDRASNDEATRNASAENARESAASGQPATSQNKVGPAKSQAPKDQPKSGTARVGNFGIAVQSEKQSTSANAGANSDRAPETRSLSGRKFRRQGNAWVDTKFKSSMAVTTVARGSDEFRALDSELRSIAERLSGEVIVVRKGKAYRIR